MVRSACAVLILCLLAARASAHGGALHPGGPEQNNFIRAKVASCRNWVPATGTIKAGKVVPSAAKLAPITVKGPVTLWQYLYKNCSTDGGPPVAGAAFDVTITRNGKPLSGVPLDGVGMTGSCASNGGSTFYFDPEAAPLDNKSNKLWFTNGTAVANGSLVGNGANDGFIRTLAQQGNREAVKSMVLVDMKTQSILACCDLQPAGPASTNWTKSMPKGKVCDDEEGHGAHKPAMKLTNGTMANGTMADDDHAGHDHAGHDHDHDHDHDHAPNATTKPATAATAKSAAGAVSAGVLGAAAAAALVLLAL